MELRTTYKNLIQIEKITAFYELLKPRLTFLVVFSSGFGYLLANNTQLNLVNLFGFLMGGFFIAGSSVVINQIAEWKLDAQMKRTCNRPIPLGSVSLKQAVIFSIITLILGIVFLMIFANFLATILSLLSLLIYAFVYTPLKRVGSIAVFVGAISGALPPLIGWAASSGTINYVALLIFGIQFIWQFPHFWAIAWLLDEDYKKVGFRMLPGKGKNDFNTAVNIMIYTLFLLPIGLLPSYFGITGLTSGVIITICGVLFLSQTFSLMKHKCNNKARKLMFGSFIYLPIVQLVILLDKV